MRHANRITLLAAAALAALWAAACLQAQVRPAAAGLRLKAQEGAGDAAALLDPRATAWQAAVAAPIGLNRTPPVYASDPPASLDIATAEVRLLRRGVTLLVHLKWKDATNDAAELGKPLARPAEGPQIYKAPSQPDRFFDACAVMLPSSPDAAAPSLQMGSPEAPVTIYFFDVVRGPAVMEARGRGTTRRTGASFPARALYDRGGWTAVLEIPAPPHGTPLSFAIWNGSQNDRDGRKYFSVWHRLE